MFLFLTCLWTVKRLTFTWAYFNYSCYIYEHNFKKAQIRTYLSHIMFQKPLTHATITGFSDITRNGDVEVAQTKTLQIIKANVKMGAISVEVSRKVRMLLSFDSKVFELKQVLYVFSMFRKKNNGFRLLQLGGGDVRNARSFSPGMTGTLVIHVSKSGNARVARFKMNPPNNVRVRLISVLCLKDTLLNEVHIIVNFSFKLHPLPKVQKIRLKMFHVISFSTDDWQFNQK